MRRLWKYPLACFGGAVLTVIVATALAAPILPLPDPAHTELSARLLPPGADGHLLGSDLLGRDILSRLVWGTRTSLLVALVATAISGIIGSTIGMVAGFYGGRLDNGLMRGIDMVMAFPYLLLALAIVAILGPGLTNALLAISIVNIPFFARTVRGSAITFRTREFITAARVAGQSNGAIICRHMLPNVGPVILITIATTFGWMILETAGLSFLGLGAQPPLADLGSMLGEGRKLILVKPWLALLPGLVVFVIVMGVNLLADGLRDALDPRLRS